MERLFKDADTSHDNFIDREELKVILQIPKVKMWLAAMELEVSDPGQLFDFLDDGDGGITVEELISGVARLKGAARSFDLMALTRRVVSMEGILASIKDILAERFVPSPLGKHSDN